MLLPITGKQPVLQTQAEKCGVRCAFNHRSTAVVRCAFNRLFYSAPISTEVSVLSHHPVRAHGAVAGLLDSIFHAEHRGVLRHRRNQLVRQQLPAALATCDRLPQPNKSRLPHPTTRRIPLYYEIKFMLLLW